MSGKLDRRKKYTRKVLKESFISLLAEKPIASITVKEICEIADINRSTFYTHYSDHYDLMEKIEEEIIEDLSEYLNSYSFTIDEESLQMTQKLLEYISRNQFMFQTLLSKNGDPTFEERLMEIAQSFMIKNWGSASQLDEQQSRYFSTFVVSGAINVIKDWIEGNMGQSPEEMAVMINHFANYGVSYLE
ncbi:TetR/AcrR family transcriptional regulator [Virgibacillus sp. MSP4-1]|uniref:TetR/AcrR family transcriptional regulator n=1 Tax=Virgibacillus sp. MSP4-1 TaxID=2700081 RepID=UPI0005C66FCD|nr:TetR-like C-terminal domain-containing protein [Virgibacillus sp. MSP4-1]QHS21737.1 TetR/AcrR family transcriptional regulator [Virgibacillus sp. MSP4-1]